MTTRWPSPDAPRSEVQAFVAAASFVDDLLTWTWEQFAKPNWIGNVGAWKATGATGIEYGIAHNPNEEKPWQLVYSHGPGNVTITGRSTDLAALKAMAENAERKDRERIAALTKRPTEARNEMLHVLPRFATRARRKHSARRLQIVRKVQKVKK